MANFKIDNFKDRLKIINQFDGNLRFGARKFHSETNRTGAGRPSDGGLVREHAKVVDDSGLPQFRRDDHSWEPVNECPVCKGERKDFFLHRQGLDIYRCQDCQHRFLNPRVKYEVAMGIYADDKTASDIYTQPLQIEIDETKYQYGLDLIEQLAPPDHNKIMDLGCGAGVMLKVADKAGWKYCIGVDANKRYSEIYKETQGIQYISTTFESLEPDRLGKDYDVISMWSVLEHLYDIHTILGQLKSMLKKKGLLFILVPNVESLATRLMREMSPTFNWKHVSHFCPKSLKTLMASHGFDCVHLETVITEIDNIKSYMSGEYPYHGYGDPEGLFDFITPEYLHSNLLGSRMIGVFRNA